MHCAFRCLPRILMYDESGCWSWLGKVMRTTDRCNCLESLEMRALPALTLPHLDLTPELQDALLGDTGPCQAPPAQHAPATVIHTPAKPKQKKPKATKGKLVKAIHRPFTET